MSWPRFRKPVSAALRPSPCTLPLPGKSSGNLQFSQETTRLSTSVTLWSCLPLGTFRVGPLALSLAHRDIHGRLAEILNLGAAAVVLQ